MSDILLSPPVMSTDPFPHFAVSSAFGAEASEKVLRWLETSAPWKLKVAEFYEQYEFSVLDCELPAEVQAVFNDENLAKLRRRLEQMFGTQLSNRQDVAAHKLVQGQRIRIHNDYIPGQETHRVLVQLNRGWQDEFGGILLFFGSDDSRDIRKAFRPAHDSSVAFQISPSSHHAVTPIAGGERFTLVLSFYEQHD
ncbi:cyclophane-containing peptide 2OG-Fe(II) oxygenase YhhC [Microvirgula aerodenitrificans]|uniref:cyclophane-containing peptide 2OG-Fe(II) oxygenase YhhC n=1 Tax=Microvirgula aerodenitrificans TaxID=57480 RepID=UPI00248D7959|nr:cyclophane-containing peptide 2OG-Fe(II) oxygenase YhhC [Microvirgula aerodenitrificans]